MAASNARNKQALQDSARLVAKHSWTLSRRGSTWPRRNGDIPAQQALYREAVALGLPLDCLDPGFSLKGQK